MAPRRAPIRPSWTEGRVPYLVGSETYYTWYRLYTPRFPTNSRPLVVLHGGPGLTHDYLCPLEELALKGPHARPVLFYDQLGNGRSSRLHKAPLSLFTVHLYIEEVTNLLRRLGLTTFDMLGHSWGGVVALEFAARDPAGLRTLVISNTPADERLFNESVGRLVAGMDRDVGEGLVVGFSDPQRFRVAQTKFYEKHMCRVHPMPREVRSMLDSIFGDTVTGRGGDFTVAKNMSTHQATPWTIVDRLDDIRVPTLLISGQYDSIQDSVCEPFLAGVRKLRWERFDKSSHLPMWEERGKYMALLREWLTNPA